MMKFLFYLCLSILVLFSCSSPVEPKTNDKINRQSNNFASFMPENDLDHEDGQFYGQTGTTEEQFNQIIDTVEQIYSPIVQNLGGNLIIEKRYQDNTVNGYASMEGSNWVVSMFGGLAKRVTPEGFALVLCHELGHFLNGYVFYPDSWASGEGGSDGFSTQVCARKIFAEEPTNDCNCGFLPENKEYSEFAQCDKFYNEQDRLICERSLKGAMSLAGLLASLNKEPIPTLNNLDRSIVTRTKLDHPVAKCRLTVYFEGAMTTKQWNDAIIPKNKAELMKYSFQTKPNCWYSGK